MALQRATAPLQDRIHRQAFAPSHAHRPSGRHALVTARPFERPATLDEEALLHALRAVRRGDFGVRLPAGRPGMAGEIAEAFNDIIDLSQRTSVELRRIGRVVGREGRFGDRASIGGASGAWARNIESVNKLVTDLTEPSVEVSRVLGAVARGDLSQRMALGM